MLRPQSSPTTKSKWTRKETMICNQTIFEVDMARAGLSVIKQEKLLPLATIHQLEALSKHEASVQIGKISRLKEYRGLAKEITTQIKDRVRMLCDLNRIPDTDIISVKRDAVFVSGVKPRLLSLPNGTEFKIKNVYSDFMNFNGVEVYFNFGRKTFDIKGMSDTATALHSEFLVEFFFFVLDLMRKGRQLDTIDTLCQFKIDYLQRNLDIGFYREFNSGSGYAIPSMYKTYIVNSLSQKDFDERAVINYNFEHIILPLFQAVTGKNY